jgi:aspartokinase
MPHRKAITKAFLTYDISLVSIMNIPDDMEHICTFFSCLAKNGINVDMISQSAPFQGKIAFSFSIPSNYLPKTMIAIEDARKTLRNILVEIDAFNSKISFFGEKMKEIPGVAAHLFSLFAKNKIMIKMITTSENDISCLIYEKDTDKAVDIIKAEYELACIEIHEF